jgi:hypothetical protein
VTGLQNGRTAFLFRDFCVLQNVQRIRTTHSAFPTPSATDTGVFSVGWVEGLDLERRAPSRVEVKNELSYNPTPPARLRGTDRYTFMLYPYFLCNYDNRLLPNKNTKQEW